MPARHHHRLVERPFLGPGRHEGRLHLGRERCVHLGRDVLAAGADLFAQPVLEEGVEDVRAFVGKQVIDTKRALGRGEKAPLAADPRVLGRAGACRWAGAGWGSASDFIL